MIILSIQSLLFKPYENSTYSSKLKFKGTFCYIIHTNILEVRYFYFPLSCKDMTNVNLISLS